MKKINFTAPVLSLLPLQNALITVLDSMNEDIHKHLHMVCHKRFYNTVIPENQDKTETGGRMNFRRKETPVYV